jgi:signal transduction histidine kinase
MQAAHESNEALHQIVWSLKPENDQLEQIAIKLTSYAIEILEPLGIQLVVDISSPLKDLRMNTEKRQDLFLVFKEIITNVCKHAEANTVNISMELHRNTLQLTVEDNGKGISAKNSAAGNGMKNMRQRIEKWKGVFEVSSNKKNQGTLIQIQLDIP